MESERRQHTRVAVTWMTRVLDKERGLCMARLADISLGGCYFLAAQALPADSVVMMEIHAPDGTGERKLLAEARVLRVQPRGDEYGHGTMFTRIRDQDLWWLVTHIAHSWAAGQNPSSGNDAAPLVAAEFGASASSAKR